MDFASVHRQHFNLADNGNIEIFIRDQQNEMKNPWEKVENVIDCKIYEWDISIYNILYW